MIAIISRLMQTSGVTFGTSGARGRVTDMSDEVCYAYTTAFLQTLTQQGELDKCSHIAIAGDNRSSTERIMSAVAMAITDMGHHPINCDRIPTPAVAYFGQENGIPSIMITGSHIPDDRNGIKFNKATGEILKDDEQAIRSQQIDISEDLFDDKGVARSLPPLPQVRQEAFELYVRRYLDFFPKDCLQGKRIGLYGHSTVAREPLDAILTGLGAEVTRLGYSERFIPVDTEAIRQEDIGLAQEWSKEHGFDCIVSADGDGDRPLISDENGEWLRGDIAGILCAQYLGSRNLATPVSSNTAVEKTGLFDRIYRTRIGSPYVIAAMNQAIDEGETDVAGYEANGGFLIATDIDRANRILKKLPTRDATVVILSVLMLASEQGKSISGLLNQLPQRFTTSDRIKDFPSELSKEKIGELAGNIKSIENIFGENFGRVNNIDTTDGLRITFTSQEIVHLRPSGNAPELRCYTEANSKERAQEINTICMDILNSWR